MRTHYPRTPHLPWSPGATSDDVRMTDLAALAGTEVVVTEKLDGENTTLYADGLHARSLDSAHHPSRTWVKALQARVGPRVPQGWRICGENMFARHSLAYESLESHFYGFSVWDGDRCLGWDRTVEFLRSLGIPAPPVLWRGVFDAKALRALKPDTGRQEGYVVRPAAGFPAALFGRVVGKWVRPGHVVTDTHWMHAAVVENGLGAGAALWAVRSGAPVDAGALRAAVGAGPEGGPEKALAAADALDALGRTGDDRLAGVLGAMLHGTRRTALAPLLVPALGMPLARRVADLVGLAPGLHRPYPDEERHAGLARMALAADLPVLHAVSGVLADTAEAREQVEWSALHAQDISEPDGLAEAFSDLGPEAAARCLAQAREAYADGRIATAEEAVAATWRWRSGDFPRLVQLAGPSGSGKSTFGRGLPGTATYISLDDLRLARGSRADQSANGDVLREGLDRLDAALVPGATVVWDATSLNPHQRSLVHAVARRRDALVTHAVAWIGEAELAARNGRREHPVPPQVLASQLHRFVPPYPGQAHRTWYVGTSGTVEDRA
ncbi:putative kinase [Streptomyces sp. KhCrAH-43]|uniref:RNA ligase family protein n=1 Tax=unclassified Streptomyces TaxID=2593676 RepID=UPI00035F3C36|nr:MULTISPECIES: RNA ligase family protein [unclassified Streptomyces]MYS38537.1 AAA family ATPase [Streptomyces sp. SID4920]MYX66729.1 AAA family ATPase [Streptomyces sp. SID8373]RAJ68223.1 putative kinase [Streptomyces sp. KhCrAH-43]